MEGKFIDETVAFMIAVAMLSAALLIGSMGINYVHDINTRNVALEQARNYVDIENLALNHTSNTYDMYGVIVQYMDRYDFIVRTPTGQVLNTATNAEDVLSAATKDILFNTNWNVTSVINPDPADPDIIRDITFNLSV